MHKCFFYFNIEPLTLKSINEIINNIINFSPTKIEKFGMASGSMKLLKKNSRELLSKLAIGYPEYFFGTLFLSDKKNDSTFYLEHRPDQFLRLQVEFTENITEKDRLAFLDQFVNEPNLMFGLMTTFEEYNKKHLKLTEYPNGGRTERYMGYDFSGGIPGVYRINYFGHILSDSLSLGKITNIQKKDYGYILNCENSLEENEIIDVLGKDLFFDIKNVDRKIKFPDVFQELINRQNQSDFSVRPQYSDPKYELNGEEARKAYENKLKNLLGHLSVEKTDTASIENFINKVLDSIEADELYNDISLACGYILGIYWSKKYSKHFNIDKGIVFDDNGQEYILSPYNTVILMKIDNLSIQEMEDCIGHIV